MMLFYIAASWKNRHAVELLTKVLRDLGHEVNSFVENHNGEFPNGNFAEWVHSGDGERCFDFDTASIKDADAVIYISPGGCDTWAEIGLAFGHSVPIYGLATHKEEIGLMGLMVTWFKNTTELLRFLESNWSLNR